MILDGDYEPCEGRQITSKHRTEADLPTQGFDGCATLLIKMMLPLHFPWERRLLFSNTDVEN